MANSMDEAYLAYSAGIYRYLLSLCRDHYLAEEIMQETFYRAYLFMESIDESKGMKPWLYKVAYHAFIDNQRKAKRNTTQEIAFFERMGSESSAEDLFIKEEEVRWIREIIRGLPEKQAQAVILYDLNGFSYQEGAEIMGIGMGSFKVLLYRGRQVLRREREDRDHV